VKNKKTLTTRGITHFRDQSALLPPGSEAVARAEQSRPGGWAQGRAGWRLHGRWRRRAASWQAAAQGGFNKGGV
jgi:hypothetical protein